MGTQGVCVGTAAAPLPQGYGAMLRLPGRDMGVAAPSPASTCCAHAHGAATSDLGAASAATSPSDITWAGHHSHPGPRARSTAKAAPKAAQFPAAVSLVPPGILSPDTQPPGSFTHHASYPTSAAGTPASREPLAACPARSACSAPAHYDASPPARRCAADAPFARPSTSYAAAPPALSSFNSCASDGTAADCGADDPAAPHAHERAWLAHPEVQASICEMLDEELATAVNPEYMEFHSEGVMSEGLFITPAMRLMTVNWMSEAVCDLNLDQKVVSMAVLLLDRYLSAVRQFPRTMLQLAAAAAIFIAAKIEGTLPHPRGSRIASLSDGAFSLDHLVQFERVLCHSVSFDLYGPTTQNFLDMFMHALPPPATNAEAYFAEKVHTLASYILELGSLVYDTLGRRRSVLATAALLLALVDPGLQEAIADVLAIPAADIAAHAAHTASLLKSYIGPGVDLSQVTVTTSELLRLHKLAQARENREQFVVVKFSSERYDSIALVARPLESVADFERAIREYYR